MRLHLWMILRCSLLSVGEGDVFLLNRGIGHQIALIRIVAVDANTFLENQFDTFFSDAVAEVNQLARFARRARNELLLPAEMLVVEILAPLFDHAFIRNIANVLNSCSLTISLTDFAGRPLSWQ